MRIGPTTRLGPDLQTEWGTYPSPVFTAPAQNSRVIEYLPPTVRGRHAFRTQPRDLSPLPADPAVFLRVPLDMLNRGRSTLIDTPDSSVAHGIGQTTDSNTGMYVFLGVLGVIAVLFAGGFGAEKGASR